MSVLCCFRRLRGLGARYLSVFFVVSHIHSFILPVFDTGKINV